jgi:hypothetical protein
LHHLTNALEEETREKCDSEFKLNSPSSSGDEFMEESGFMGDDEEDLSSDDSNNEVEFFPVHQQERNDMYQQSDEPSDNGSESEMDLESDISDEGVNLESFDSSTCFSSNSDSDYASREKEVNEHDFNHADLEEILLDETDVDGPTELRNFLATFVTNKNLSGSAGNYLLKGLKALKHQNNQST